MGGSCRAWAVFGMLGVLLAGAPRASAGIVLFEFDADLVSVEPGWEAYFGATAQGTLLVNAGVTDVNPSPSTGDYPGAVLRFSLSSPNPGYGFTMNLDGTSLEVFVLNGPIWDKIVFSKNPMALNIPTALNGQGAMGFTLTSPAGVSLWETDALIVDAAALLPLSQFVQNSIALSYTDTVLGTNNPAEYTLTAIRSSVVSSVAPVAAGSGSTGQLLGGSFVPGGISAVFESTSGGTFLATQVQPGTSEDFQTRVGSAVTLSSFDLGFVGAWSGGVTLSFGYSDDPLGVGPALKDAQEEAMLHVYHRANAAGPWEELPAVIDSASNTITVTTTSLSPFVVATAAAAAPVVPLLGTGASALLAMTLALSGPLLGVRRRSQGLRFPRTR